MSDGQGPKPTGRLAMSFVGLTGFAAVVVGAVGNFMHDDSGANIAFIVAGVAAVVVAPMLPRLKKFEVTATGATLETFESAEEQVEKGQLVEADKAVKLVEAAFTSAGSLDIQAEATGTGVVTENKPLEEQRVFLTADAIADLGKLDAADRSAIDDDLDHLGTVPDPRAIEPNSGGKSYFVHRTPANLRVYYRQLDKTNPNQPDQYVVLKIQKKT